MSIAVGAIENGHVLTAHDGWVRLNPHAPHAGPWRSGDVVGGHAFTGDQWVAMPSAWLPDPTGRHEFRWWTGQFWSQHALTNGRHSDDPMTSPVSSPAKSPPVRPLELLRSARDFWSSIRTVATVLYCGSWFLVALYSVSVAASEGNPRYLILTATASGNVFAYKLNMTYSELKRQLTKEFKAKILFVAAGAVLAGGVWLSLHFDDPGVLGVTAAMVLIVLIFAWAFD